MAGLLIKDWTRKNILVELGGAMCTFSEITQEHIETSKKHTTASNQFQHPTLHVGVCSTSPGFHPLGPDPPKIAFLTTIFLPHGSNATPRRQVSLRPVRMNALQHRLSHPYFPSRPDSLNRGPNGAFVSTVPLLARHTHYGQLRVLEI